MLQSGYCPLTLAAQKGRVEVGMWLIDECHHAIVMLTGEPPYTDNVSALAAKSLR